MKGDIVFVDLPTPAGPQGREQIGHRPAIICSNDTTNPQEPTIIVIPLTSQLSAGRFNFTFRIEPSGINGLSQPSIALVFQIRAIDRTRITNHLGHLEDNYISVLNQNLRNLLLL
jgi:mRNA interferase MazF